MGSRSRITRVVSGFEATLLLDALDFGETVESSPPPTTAGPNSILTRLLDKRELLNIGLLMVVDVAVETDLSQAEKPGDEASFFSAHLLFGCQRLLIVDIYFMKGTLKNKQCKEN